MILELVKTYNAESGAEAEVILEHAVNIIRQTQNKIEQSKIAVMEQGNQIAAHANRLKEEELFIKRTVPLEVAKTQKAGSENVALINKEAKLNESVEDRILQNNQHLQEMELADKQEMAAFSQPAAQPQGA
jgi:hypothetical protein